ncbi:MAG TPA: hypothetical protein VK588_01050, partial [Chitinophagaceae bacterium]|nr:hypothetical protein [Chitinophagaceae bacterium]
MENIFKEYEKLVEKLYTSKDDYSEDNLVIFTPAKGTSYNAELMIVGRAVNGWKNGINKTNKANKEEILKGVHNSLMTDDLEWVYGSWGSTTGYNTNKSAFWRVVNELAIQFAGIEEGAINNIVWSNLFKVAKEEGGNPSARLRNVQFAHCLNLLRLEIEFFKPKYVVFLTDYYGWAEPFIKGLGVKKKKRSDSG